MKKEAATKLVNEYGRNQTPFLLIADFELEKIIVEPITKLSDSIFYNFNGVTNIDVSIEESTLSIKKIIPHSFTEYYKEFDTILDEIKYGNTFLINLTSRSEIEIDSSLEKIYYSAKAKYKLLLNNELVVFSPETFVKINNGIISSYPMKGTIDASLLDAEEILLNDPKELSEHYTIVDLIRNDLSINAKQVDVNKFRYVDEIKSDRKNLLQVSSEIRGVLPTDYHSNLGDIIFSMLPAGSISGAPKKKTIEIIKSVEPNSRGFYTGICGLFDGKNFDSFVMIRYIEKDRGKFYYRSGGGLTSQSDVEKEYLEMIDKIYIPKN